MSYIPAGVVHSSYGQIMFVTKLRRNFSSSVIRKLIDNCKNTERHTFPKIEVTLTSDSDEIDKWIANHIYCAGNPVDSIGFDIEWKPNFSKNPGAMMSKASLLQLATANKVLLVQLFQLKKIPDSLYDIVSSEKLLKVGVSVFDDLKRMQVSRYLISPSGLIVEVSFVTHTRAILTYTHRMIIAFL